MTLLSGAAAALAPLAARAQQPLPVIAYLSSGSPKGFATRLAAFREGLAGAGFHEGQNVAIEYRWADGQDQRLPAMAADLVQRRVNVIAAPGGLSAARAAKAATRTIPVVFETGANPVEAGLVASLRQPEANVTGVASVNVEVGPKRLELLHELVPAAKAVAFARLRERRAGALVVSPDPFYNSRSERLGTLTLQHAMPAAFHSRDFIVSGGLIAYGGSVAESHRQAGIYTARILKGDKPSNLPVQQVTKVELVLNLKTAKALGLDIPPTLLALADEVIE